MATVNSYCPALVILTQDKAKSALIKKTAVTKLKISEEQILEFNPTKGQKPLDTISKLPLIHGLSKENTALLMFIDKFIAIDPQNNYLSNLYRDLKNFFQDKVACSATVLLDTGIKDSNIDNISPQILSTRDNKAAQFKEHGKGSNLPSLGLDEGTEGQWKPEERLRSALRLFLEAINPTQDIVE